MSGKKATVVEDIDKNKLLGRIKIGDNNWKAVSFDGKPIIKGRIVTIVSYVSIFLPLVSI